MDNTGNVLGIAPIHRRIEFSETLLLRISGDRIAEITFQRISWTC